MTQTDIDIVDLFCTPPVTPETDFDLNVLADAEIVDISFNGQKLVSYAWGSGPNVLLAHGWGSRASHLAALKNILVMSGFRIIAFDQPAHGRSVKVGQPNRSSFIEFCQAIATVASQFEPLYALIGHSLGGAASAFVVSGSPVIPKSKVETERLVLISSPANITAMFDHFCRATGLYDRKDELAYGIESGFGFPLDAYAIDIAMQRCNARVLIAHAQNDTEIPCANAHRLSSACDTSQLLEIEGSGHSEILANRTMLRTMRDFLKKL